MPGEQCETSLCEHHIQNNELMYRNPETPETAFTAINSLFLNVFPSFHN